MWIMTPHGFLSIVRAHAPGPKAYPPKAHPDLMMVRARCWDHLAEFVKWLPEGDRPEIMQSVGTDYPYRVIVAAALIPPVLAGMAEAKP